MAGAAGGGGVCYSDRMRLEALRRWAVVLDSLFRVPGTSIRFGLDALVGLIPGIGDIASPVYTSLILLEGVRRRVPMVVQARMVLNAAIDMGVGLVPLLGDIVDVAWKANLRNLALLERYLPAGDAAVDRRLPLRRILPRAGDGDCHRAVHHHHLAADAVPALLRPAVRAGPSPSNIIPCWCRISISSCLTSRSRSTRRPEANRAS